MGWRVTGLDTPLQSTRQTPGHFPRGHGLQHPCSSCFWGGGTLSPEQGPSSEVPAGAPHSQGPHFAGGCHLGILSSLLPKPEACLFLGHPPCLTSLNCSSRFLRAPLVLLGWAPSPGLAGWVVDGGHTHPEVGS